MSVVRFLLVFPWTCIALTLCDAFGSSGIQSRATSVPKSLALSTNTELPTINRNDDKEKVVIIGGGWGGLSAAYELSKNSDRYDVVLVDMSSRVGGVVRDGFRSMRGDHKAEAGQHGFWDQYANIFRLLDEDLDIIDDALTGYAEQGQYSPNGLEAVWPVYRNQIPQLPTGLAQAAYTRFEKLPWIDRVSAFPLVLAFSEFDDSPEAWERYDQVSFRDLCLRLGVSRRCYQEAFEPMILTGLFAPGAECSAAAALGMAYFFVMANQNAFDVRWCKGNIGEKIFDPWVRKMESSVTFRMSTKVTGFNVSTRSGNDGLRAKITSISCVDTNTQEEVLLKTDQVVFAVGAAALNAMVQRSPELSTFPEFRRFANLRGTSVLATRLYLDKRITTPYTANACWGFDEGVGMTMFNIGELHSDESLENLGSVIEVDYYHADSLLVMSDKDIVKKVKADLSTILGVECASTKVIDAAIIRLPRGVNWYFPGSYKSMPDVQASSLDSVYFAGDLVRSRHGSWSQEKAFVTGIEASNLIQGKPIHEGVIPLPKDELHVAFGRSIVATFQSLLGRPGRGTSATTPSLFDFIF
ncbi:flavin containing amine oxidoreductase [Nitzschia inconspicua]|uniref:Flavin containing amine oxidoreductase n=1 Tax=Nitzschia inconspicua TaxID=303405 RepID=A0A9K3PXP4_9STRA|nr:flavin containing amine oxidoreductase [Nitzschia inconspicua]KAG7363478.1 flavin containing amine oxidoreductase [Nitzschia inconspicua]